MEAGRTVARTTKTVQIKCGDNWPSTMLDMLRFSLSRSVYNRPHGEEGEERERLANFGHGKGVAYSVLNM